MMLCDIVWIALWIWWMWRNQPCIIQLLTILMVLMLLDIMLALTVTFNLFFKFFVLFCFLFFVHVQLCGQCSQSVTLCLNIFSTWRRSESFSTQRITIETNVMVAAEETGCDGETNWMLYFSHMLHFVTKARTSQSTNNCKPSGTSAVITTAQHSKTCIYWVSSTNN